MPERNAHNWILNALKVSNRIQFLQGLEIIVAEIAVVGKQSASWYYMRPSTGDNSANVAARRT